MIWPSDDAPMIEWAAAYHDAGYAVVPANYALENGACSCGNANCQAVGKHPAVQWREYTRKRPDMSQIRRWWTLRPMSNIAIITGRVSGIVVLDIDPRHGGDDAIAGWNIPDTPTVITGGGGQHYWFKYEEGSGSRTGVLPGVDIRGDGGIVIAPPSRHASGRRWEWDAVRHIAALELAAMPQQMRQLVLVPAAGREPIDLGAVMLSPIPEGRRNETLTRIAGVILARGGDVFDAIDILRRVNSSQCMPPLPDAEVDAIVRSIWRRESGRRAALDMIASAESEVAAAAAAAAAVMRQPRTVEPAGIADIAAELAGLGIPHQLVRCELFTTPSSADLQLEFLRDGELVVLEFPNAAGGGLSLTKFRQTVAAKLKVILPETIKPKDWSDKIVPKLLAMATIRDIGSAVASATIMAVEQSLDASPPEDAGDGYAVDLYAIAPMRSARYLARLVARVPVLLREHDGEYLALSQQWMASVVWGQFSGKLDVKKAVISMGFEEVKLSVMARDGEFQPTLYRMPLPTWLRIADVGGRAADSVVSP